MKYHSIILGLVTAAVVFVSCKSDDDEGVASNTNIQEKVVNVDVILPAEIQKNWENSIEWALANLEKAQRKESRRVKLNLRYHDEDTEDLEALAARLTLPKEGDDTCHAIIGPYHSINARKILKYASTKRLPVVMPSCSSAELQRIYARSTYAWFLTESDVTQCEIMLSAASALGKNNVALIYSDDTYGVSFNDWFGYYATEKTLYIPGIGTQIYAKGTNLKPFLDNIAENSTEREVMVLIALSEASDYEDVCNQLSEYEKTNKKIKFVPIGSDTSDDPLILNTTKKTAFTYGISPVGDMSLGYPQSYYSRFHRNPFNGEAQVYDALTIIALGALKQWVTPDQCEVHGKQVIYTERPYSLSLTDYMRSVMNSDDGVSCGWQDGGLAIACHEIVNGRTADITGASSEMVFDENSNTKILHTSYKLWSLYQNQVSENTYTSYQQPIIYLSTRSVAGSASTLLAWEQDKKWLQSFDIESVYDVQLPELKDKWAVVVSPSTTWANYRHQADAFAMYQLLRQSGYDDDHIVLIVEDNLSNSEANKDYPGQIFVENVKPGGQNENVRAGAKVDYHFSDLQPADVADIMLGRSSDRLTSVISPNANSDVFFFWSGHGGSREGPLWGNEDANQYFGTERIKDIVTQMEEKKMFRRMMFALETCYSGRWGEALIGQPNVLVLTAANSHEESNADVHDPTIGVFLSNAFSRSFRKLVSNWPQIPIYDLYKELAKTTIGSHVTLYNQQNYGSVYDDTMEEYFTSN